MPDPGVVPGIIGVLIAKLVDFVLQEAGKVVNCKEECSGLKKLVEPLQPILPTLAPDAAGNVSADLRPWVSSLQECLMQAVELIKKCSGPPISPFNIVDRYSLSNDVVRVKNELDLLMKQELIIRLIRESTPYGRQWGSSSQQPLEVKLPKEMFGIEEASQRLERALLEEEGMWVGLWGQGGSGKTLLAQRANNSRRVRDHFKEGLFLLTVSKEPNIQRLQGKLHKMVTGRDEHFESEEEGQTELYNLLKDKKALLILDDVWSVKVRDSFDVLTEGSGSKILVTSRKEQVVRKGFHEQVRLLNEEDSTKLFCTHAFQDMFPGKHSPDFALQALEAKHGEEFVSVVRDIVAECKHLPLALKVIGGSLDGKAPPEFRLALKHLRKSQGFTGDAEMYERLKWSYDDLAKVEERGEVLQQCFLYFGAFPEDYEVKLSQLIRYWVGEGLIGYNDIGLPDTDTAWYLVHELSRRSLIEISWEGEAGVAFRKHKLSRRSLLEISWEDETDGAFRMHDVLRDLAVRLAKGQDAISLLEPGKGLATLPEEWTHQESRLKARRLSLMDNELQVVPRACLEAPEVTVLMLNGNDQLRRIEEGFLINFPNLRVLDLHWTQIEHLPDDFSSLKKLVVLDLRGGPLTPLPSSTWPSCIGEMADLQYLDLSQWDLSQWDLDNSDQLGNLVNLRSLDIRFSGKHFPDGLQALTSLVHLHFVKCSQLKELPALDELKKLRCVVFYDCESLERLSPTFGREGGFPVLESLRMFGCPKFSEFPKLEKGALPLLSKLLVHDDCELSELDESLQVLTGLRSLSLWSCTRLATLPSSEAFSCLQKLEALHLDKTGVTELPYSIGQLPLLKTLNVSGCKKLRGLPWPDEKSNELFPSLEKADFSWSRVQHIPLCMFSSKLRSISLHGCPNDPKLLKVMEDIGLGAAPGGQFIKQPLV